MSSPKLGRNARLFKDGTVIGYAKDIRAWGMNLEQVLARAALAEGAIARVNPRDLENHQLVVLSNQLKELIRHETTG